MINSANALEFLKPTLIMDKYNSSTATKLFPSSARTFVTIGDHHQYRYQSNAIDSQQHQKFLLSDEKKNKQQERIKVQHLENHTKLQNNKCWNNFRTLYNNISASSINNSVVNDREMCKFAHIKDDSKINVVNIEHLPVNSVQQNKSAFNLDLNNKKYYNNNNSICRNKNLNNIQVDPSANEESNNNQFYCNQNKKILLLTQSAEPIQRTEDQNNAYRHIESVHNYAKSKSYIYDHLDNQSPNDSRHSSLLDDDEDDDEEEEDDDIEAKYGDGDNDIEYNERLEDNDLDADYESYFRSRQIKFQKLSTSDGAHTNKSYCKINSKFGNIIESPKHAHYVSASKDQKNQTANVICKNKTGNGNDDIHVDVETVESQSLSSPNAISVVPTNFSNGLCDESSAVYTKPDHHARRPMNAFLIFCKRHRTIVKERYKNLENRAITKILGDWWASLDTSDKNCFINLAQQNKDAFFSANPNFKWYKLPAPPLRNLAIRPINSFGPEDDNECSNGLEIISNNIRCSNNNHSNYFKLADEAQMGDLSQLMKDKSKTNIKECTDLQQALGETSQFLSAYITGNAESCEENSLKRRSHNENSFSSNSSEEEGLEPKKKCARSCKGKRYQELLNSGQIATAVKKSKPTTRLGDGGGDNIELNNVGQHFSRVDNLNIQKRSGSLCKNIETYDLNGFDLEEKIKELPALNLDDYLLRKRNIKKKKKFSSNGRKRGHRSNTNTYNNNNNSSVNNNGNLSVKTTNERHQQQLYATHNQQTAITPAVGSQKRKARKESITRRDVSAIEQEVASLLPLTINGCCYFQEAPAVLKCIKANEKDTDATETQKSLNVTSTSPIIPLQQQQTITTSSVSCGILNAIHNNSNSNNTLNDNISSSTSDLLILAEVAANRTELKP